MPKPPTGLSISSLFYIIGGQYLLSKLWNLVPISGYAGGLDAFKLRVSLNALDLVTRQLTLQAGGEAAEAERLASLLTLQGRLGELNRALADRIATGEADLQTPGLADHLWQTTMAKLAVDQPNYGSYKRELERK